MCGCSDESFGLCFRLVCGIFFLILAILIAAFALFHRDDLQTRPVSSLTIYCAAGLKTPIEAICKQFGVTRPTLYRYVRLETASQSPATGRVGRKGTPTGHLAHLEAKAEGDHSMPGTPEAAELV